MDNDLISREALKKAIMNDLGLGDEENGSDAEYMSGLQDCYNLIDNAPEVDISKLILIVATRSGKREMMLNALRPHGEWNYIQAGMCVCPFCGAMPHKQYKNFCPKCGAKLEGGAKE